MKFSPKLKSLLSETQQRVQKFDEYDYYNRKTGRKDWVNCKVICGLFKVEKITELEQKDPYSSIINYYEKFYPTAFNELIISADKHYGGETRPMSIVAKKYEGEETKLIE